MSALQKFTNNLFGTIAGGTVTNPIPPNISFIPQNNQGNVTKIKGDTAVWLGLKTRAMQKATYEFCYPFAAIVDKLAEFDITGTLEIIKTKGKAKDNIATGDWATRMMKLLKRPNPYQSWEQFRGQQVMYKKIFGFAPIMPTIPAGFGPEYASSIVNLPPWLFDVVRDSESKAVKKYVINLLGTIIELEPSQVFILEDSFMPNEMDSYLLPQSRLVGLDMAVSNLCAAMEADNVLLRKKGPLGFVSHDSAATKDAVAGYQPMTKTEKEEVQRDLAAYGMSWDQYQYVITRTSMKWNSMSFNVKELGTKETVVSSEKAICHRYNFPYVLYEETDATYANGENASMTVYQNNIIPNNKKDLAKYNDFFKADEAQCLIRCCYDDLAVLQEDALNQGKAKLAQNQSLQILWMNGIITKNQWLLAQDMEAIPDGDVYYVAPVKNDPTNKENDKNTPPKD